MLKELRSLPRNWEYLLSVEEEDRQLRIAALRNAEEILIARNRVEQELRDAKEALENKIQELEEQREWFQVTLASIGDAVITTDAACMVTFLNPIAEAMTGWTSSEAAGAPLASVLTIVNELTQQPVEHPVTRVLGEGRIGGLATHVSGPSRRYRPRNRGQCRSDSGPIGKGGGDGNGFSRCDSTAES